MKKKSFYFYKLKQLIKSLLTNTNTKFGDKQNLLNGVAIINDQYIAKNDGYQRIIFDN